MNQFTGYITSDVTALEGCYDLQADYYDGYFIHFLAFMNKWAIDGSGASYLQVNKSNDLDFNDTIPDYGYIVEFLFTCYNTTEPTTASTLYVDDSWWFCFSNCTR